MLPPNTPAPGHHWQEKRHTILLRAGGGDPQGVPPPHRVLAGEVAALLPQGAGSPTEDWFRSVVQRRGAHRCLLPMTEPPCALEIVTLDAGEGETHALITLRQLAPADERWRAAERLEVIAAAFATLAHQANNILTCMQTHAEWLPETPGHGLGAGAVLAAVGRWKRMTGQMGRLGQALRPRPGRCDPARQLIALADRKHLSLPSTVSLGLGACEPVGLLPTSNANFDRVIGDMVSLAVGHIGEGGHLQLRMSLHPSPAWPGFGLMAVSLGGGVSFDRATAQECSDAPDSSEEEVPTSLENLAIQAAAQGLGGNFSVRKLCIRDVFMVLRLPVKLNSTAIVIADAAAPLCA